MNSYTPILRQKAKVKRSAEQFTHQTNRTPGGQSRSTAHRWLESRVVTGIATSLTLYAGGRTPNGWLPGRRKRQAFRFHIFPDAEIMATCTVSMIITETRPYAPSSPYSRARRILTTWFLRLPASHIFTGGGDNLFQQLQTTLKISRLSVLNALARANHCQYRQHCQYALAVRQTTRALSGRRPE